MCWWVADRRPPTVRPLWDVGGSRPAARSADGFRLDLASVLSRRPSGEPMPNPPVLWDIESDPVLAGPTVMVIATTVTTLEAQGEVATLTLKRGWGRIAGRDETRTENVNRASAPQSSE
jgi:pullulanase/glycogen debranching enzyme